MIQTRTHRDTETQRHTDTHTDYTHTHSDPHTHRRTCTYIDIPAPMRVEVGQSNTISKGPGI